LLKEKRGQSNKMLVLGDKGGKLTFSHDIGRRRRSGNLTLKGGGNDLSEVYFTNLATLRVAIK